MKKNGFKKLIYTILLTGTFALTGCNKKTEVLGGIKSAKKDAQTSGKITVGFSIDTLAMERWQRDLDVFMNTVNELGANIIVQNAGNNLDEQKRQIHYLGEKGIDVLVIVPKDAEELSDSVQKIRAKNIPVVSYDRLIRNCDVDLYVTIDCYEVGRLMANGMLNRTTKRNWYCILGAKEDFNMTMVSTGLRQAIIGRHININNIFYTDGWNYDLSYQHMLELISSKKIPEVLICGNDAIASSLLQALRECKYNGHIPICGQDADIEACQNILNGSQDFTIYKPIMELAEKSAELAVELAKSKSADKIEGISEKINNGAKDVPVFWLKPTLVDKNNIEEIIINSGFHSKSEIYK